MIKLIPEYKFKSPPKAEMKEVNVNFGESLKVTISSRSKLILTFAKFSLINLYSSSGFVKNLLNLYSKYLPAMYSL